MKRQIAGVGMILLGIVLPALVLALIQRFSPTEVAVYGAEYHAGPVTVRIYADEKKQESYWVLMGTRSDEARVTLLDGEGRAVLSTTGYADARQDHPVRVRIDRLHLGMVWVPEQVLTFRPKPGQLPLRTAENAARLTAEFRAVKSQ